MKILHTSDWHLGHTLYGYDRTSGRQRVRCGFRQACYKRAVRMMGDSMAPTDG